MQHSPDAPARLQLWAYVERGAQLPRRLADQLLRRHHQRPVPGARMRALRLHSAHWAPPVLACLRCGGQAGAARGRRVCQCSCRPTTSRAMLGPARLRWRLQQGTRAQVCPTCIFLVEGGGQANYCSTNWGNGFATSKAIVGQNGVSDATPFFQAVLNQPWLSQACPRPPACLPPAASCGLPPRPQRHLRQPAAAAARDFQPRCSC